MLLKYYSLNRTLNLKLMHLGKYFNKIQIDNSQKDQRPDITTVNVKNNNHEKK